MKLKKSLGQHFLHDEQILHRIGAALPDVLNVPVLEVGAGAGALTKHLLLKDNMHLKVVEIDKEKCNILRKQFVDLVIIQQDVLTMSIPFTEPFWVVGNFPYYISTQIMFKLLDWKNELMGVVGMFQKEVAERICSKHNSKQYGILSVLLQSYFDVTYLFDVPPTAFTPPPKVMSGVIKLTPTPNAFEGNFSQLRFIVKAAFNQRRKMLRNSLKSAITPEDLQRTIFTKRPEHLSPNEFQALLPYLIKTLL